MHGAIGHRDTSAFCLLCDAAPREQVRLHICGGAACRAWISWLQIADTTK